MSKQLTLFGTVAKVKNLDTIYAQPSNNYKKFVESTFKEIYAQIKPKVCERCTDRMEDLCEESYIAF